MTVAQLVGFVLKLSVALIVMGIGLGSTFRDGTYLLRRPDLLLRSLLAMNGIMLLFAMAAILALDLDPAVALALCAIALSPVPPILPTKQFKVGGSEAYVVGLLAAAAGSAVIIVPLGLVLVGWVTGRSLPVSMSAVASAVAASVLVPLVLGMSIRWLAPHFAQRLAPWASTTGTVLLVAAFVPILFQLLPALLAVLGNGLIVALLGFAVVGLVVGHCLGGPRPNNRAVLALATSTRHPGVALAICSTLVPDAKGVIAILLWHLIIGALVSLPYMNRMVQLNDPNHGHAGPDVRPGRAT